MLLLIGARLAGAIAVSRWRAGALANHLLADSVALLLQGHPVVIRLCPSAAKDGEQQRRFAEYVHVRLLVVAL
ncbi:hypothetical protein QYS36_20915 [Pseudomonas sp. G34]|uniref:hypothetical protein n=1 Tax=Pseudomonas sp. G34 TaxID=3059083 RepID=UPI002809BB3C|nr:hypothetical protein [Pseudomonas sp. G34]MDQ7987407.1 hypothetical protein [Pseudomonas sp. G34]